MKKLITLISSMTLLIFMLFQSIVSAQTFGSDSQNPYHDKGCTYGNIAANNYIDKLYNTLSNPNYLPTSVFVNIFLSQSDHNRSEPLSFIGVTVLG
jgi:hypothetical protein